MTPPLLIRTSLLLAMLIVSIGCASTRDPRMWLQLARNYGAEAPEAKTRGYLMAAVATAHAQLGDAPMARAAAAEAVQTGLAMPEGDWDRTRIITRAGLVHMRLGDVDEAMRTVHQQISAEAMPWYWIDLAQVAAEHRDWMWFDTMLIAAEQSAYAIESDPERQLLWAYLAFVNQQHGREEQSQRWMKKVHASWLRPKMMADAALIDAHHGLEDRAQERLRKASKLLEAIGRSDSSSTARTALTRVRILIGDWHDAVDAADAALTPFQSSTAYSLLAYRAATDGDLDRFEDARARAEEIIAAWSAENAGRRLHAHNIAIVHWDLAEAFVAADQLERWHRKVRTLPTYRERIWAAMGAAQELVNQRRRQQGASTLYWSAWK